MGRADAEDIEDEECRKLAESLRSTSLVESALSRLEAEETAFSSLLEELQSQLDAVNNEIEEKRQAKVDLAEQYMSELKVAKRGGERWAKRRRQNANGSALPEGDPIAHLIVPFHDEQVDGQGVRRRLRSVPA